MMLLKDFKYPHPMTHRRLNITVACQPPFRPLYVINTTSSRLPVDWTGKPLSRTARRTLQLVNPTISSEVMSGLST